MNEPRHYILACSGCNTSRPTVRLWGFAFDHEGTLHLLGVCILCLGTVKATHTMTEIQEDIRSAMEYEQSQHEQEVQQLRDELDNINWDELDGT